MRLRKELLWTIALKLVLLFSIKFAFFPQRLPADEAARRIADQIAAQAPANSESVSKEKP
jgi:hypothetical protein